MRLLLLLLLLHLESEPVTDSANPARRIQSRDRGVGIRILGVSRTVLIKSGLKLLDSQQHLVPDVRGIDDIDERQGGEGGEVVGQRREGSVSIIEEAGDEVSRSEQIEGLDVGRVTFQQKADVPVGQVDEVHVVDQRFDALAETLHFAGHEVVD